MKLSQFNVSMVRIIRKDLRTRRFRYNFETVGLSTFLFRTLCFGQLTKMMSADAWESAVQQVKQAKRQTRLFSTSLADCQECWVTSEVNFRTYRGQQEWGTSGCTPHLPWGRWALSSPRRLLPPMSSPKTKVRNKIYTFSRFIILSEDGNELLSIYNAVKKALPSPCGPFCFIFLPGKEPNGNRPNSLSVDQAFRLLFAQNHQPNIYSCRPKPHNSPR